MTIVLTTLALTFSLTAFVLVAERDACKQPLTPALSPQAGRGRRQRRGQPPSPRHDGEKVPAGG